MHSRRTYAFAVREYSPSSLGLSGSILIAHPSLLDPNFRRSVVFISQHDNADGAFGLVLTRPTGKTVVDFLPDKTLGSVAQVPVFFGGPVATDQLTFATFRWDAQAETIRCQTHLALEDAWEFTDDEKCSVRAFIGYSGWSSGQLEEELSQRAWLVQKPDRDLLDAAHSETLWQAIMREQGPWFKLLAEAPDDPSLN
jgi:putative transcriptional regulator